MKHTLSLKSDLVRANARGQLIVANITGKNCLSQVIAIYVPYQSDEVLFVLLSVESMEEKRKLK